MESVSTLEGRDKVYNWLTGEAIPSGDHDTRLIVVGNLLHEDSLIMRLKKSIDDGNFNGVFKSYPIIDDDGNITWPGKFPTLTEINAERIKIGNEVAWQREYMLRIVPDDNRLVLENWIKYYDQLPSETGNDYRFAAIGIDLALSKNEKADYTAMIPAKIYGRREDLRIFILPNIVNERLSSLESQQKAEKIARTLRAKLFVEDVGYQGSFIEQMRTRGISADGCKVYGQDKRARLSMVTFLIQSGQVLFPKAGAKELISQLINFGFQKHDDVADALAILLMKILEDYNRPLPEVFFL